MNEIHEFSALLNRALSGDCIAMFEVGECFASGDGVEKNVGTAIRWIKRAADKGDIDSMFELARCYCIGMGVMQDLSIARRWLQQAYDADDLTKSPPARSRAIRDDVSRLLMRYE